MTTSRSRPSGASPQTPRVAAAAASDVSLRALLPPLTLELTFWGGGGGAEAQLSLFIHKPSPNFPRFTYSEFLYRVPPIKNIFRSYTWRKDCVPDYYSFN